MVPLGFLVSGTPQAISVGGVTYSAFMPRKGRHSYKRNVELYSMYGSEGGAVKGDGRLIFEPWTVYVILRPDSGEPDREGALGALDAILETADGLEQNGEITLEIGPPSFIESERVVWNGVEAAVIVHPLELPIKGGSTVLGAF